jgi:long-chain acyl-CoA synthetase
MTSTLVDLVRARLDATPDAVAYRHRTAGGWGHVTWREVDRRVEALAAGLHALGVRPGDRVAILAATRLEWILAELATWRVGAVVVTIYPSSTAEDARFVLADAGCVAVFVDDARQLAKVRAVRDRLPALREVILLEGRADGARALADLRGPPAPAPPTGPDDLAALIYTSGTTGRPKGVMLSHDGFVAVCETTARHTPLEPGDEQFLFLPLAHSYGIIVALVALHVGTPTALDGDVDRIVDGLVEVRPTFLPAVPRVFEKVHERILDRARSASARRHAVFRWAEDVGRRWSRAVRSGRSVPLALRAQHRVADRLVFRKVRAAFGGRIRAFASGGAPLAPELAEFFHGAGIPVLEGYGLTESTAVSCSNRLDAMRIGTVGQPADGLELRLADDGEVLLRGRTVMRGYWNLPDETAEALVDGWLHTGDVGELDPDGFLRITDRKKHLIVTSGGKNIAPAKLENLLKARSSLVGEALVHGDRRRYCVALLALDPDALASFARREGLTGDAATLARHPRVREAVAADVAAVNAELASFETIKDFVLLDTMPTVEDGSLTPSLKLKRRVLERRHADQLEALYR